ncbi:response regulator transcription factor [Lapidilactobacillus luobeiensis]|uniref:response regulator transcription factor n=1 Tax=Lapidilactobacillus luobeiensis TaxID=2950371 RepID=UPI0021C2C6B4|nr:response regulator [Lapidilactobacillus luobeiensis]
MGLPKAIIIDDERLNADGIKKLIEYGKMPIEICAVFYSSSQALAYLVLNKVDIILTDIKMPQISGLELVSQIRQENNDAEIIIFTGYGSLAYAQEAMQYGIKYFLEKPVLPDKLYTSIQNSIKDWRHHRQEKRLNNKQLIENILAGDQDFQVEELEMASVTFREEYFDQLRELMETFFDQQEPLYNRINNSGCMIYYTFSASQFQLLIESIKKVDIPPIVIAIESSFMMKDLLEKTRISQQVIEMDYYLGDRYQIFIDRIPFSAQEQDKILTSWLNQLKSILMSGELDSVLANFDELASKCCQTLIAPARFKYLFMQMVQEVMRSTGVSANISQHFEKDHLLSSHLDDTRSRLEEIIEILRENQKLKEPLDKVVKKVNELIDQQYGSSDLSLKWIANNVLFLNQDYVGKRYLAVTGRKFSVALTEKRMKESIRLLQQGYKVYEVADAVGFGNNPDYFGQQFKKYYRVTPHQYLKQRNN